MAREISAQSLVVLQAIGNGLSYEQIVAGGYAPNYRALFDSVNDVVRAVQKEGHTGEKNRKYPRSGQSWNEEEDSQLKELIEAGTSINGIARKIERSSFAVECRLSKLGLIVKAIDTS